jgi:uncharacterized damage-inducible protein DinB/TfoX/Sxy family transcriptional regulator of competence genes
MSLGQLALHVASIPGDLARLAQLDQFDASQANFDPASPNSVQEVLSALERSVGVAEQYLRGISDEAAGSSWRLTLRGKEVFTIPRASLLRSLMLNHWYHHRGQLSVYLRMVNVPIPVIYGRSADENPFAWRLIDAIRRTDSPPASQALAEEVNDSEVTIKDRHMFGGLAIMVNGHMCCGLVGKDLVVRVAVYEYEEGLSQPHARPMDFTGRPMLGFIYVDPAGFSSDAQLRAWIRRGLHFVLSLPAKWVMKCDAQSRTDIDALKYRAPTTESGMIIYHPVILAESACGRGKAAWTRSTVCTHLNPHVFDHTSV